MGAQADAALADLIKQVERATKMLTLEIDANLRKATPVDTGHARANWVPSVGAPAAAIALASASAEHDAGVARVLQFRLADGAAFVTNNVPYIQALNLGHSKQAPVGFFEQAAADAEATVQARFAGLRIELGAGTYEDLAASYTPTPAIAAYTPKRAGRRR